MQFAGQTHVLTRRRAERPTSSATTCSRAFERAYWERFEVELPSRCGCLLVNLRTADRRTAARGVARAAWRAPPAGGARRDAQAAGAQVWFDGAWHDDARLPARTAAASARNSTGPAIVEQLDTTTVVEPGDRVAVDRSAIS